jgi:EmrB/QacA subfamily drug resistance transporter
LPGGTPLTEAACRRLTLIATVLGSSMASVTAINVALPEIRRDFGIGFAAQQWIILSYSLALASLYLVAGALDDRLGRRRMFIVGTAGFALASSLGGVAPSAPVLILARILQGAAGALLTTGSLSLLRSTFGDESGRAIGIWATGTGAVALGGPPLGGALVEWASWRWIFFLNVPLAIVAISLAWVAHRGITRTEPPRSKLDVLGAGLVALGIGSLTYGLVQGGEQGFTRVAWAFLLTGASLGVFIVHEGRTRDPLLPLSLFRRRDFALVNVATFLIYSAVAGSTFFLVLFLQSVVGYTPFQTGLLLLPSTAAILLLAALFGRLSDRYGPRTFLVVGPIVMAGGMLLWLRVDDRSLVDGLLPGIVLYGVGLSMIVAPILCCAHDRARAVLRTRSRNQLDLFTPRQPPRYRHPGRGGLARLRGSNRRSRSCPICSRPAKSRTHRRLYRRFSGRDDPRGSARARGIAHSARVLPPAQGGTACRSDRGSSLTSDPS